MCVKSSFTHETRAEEEDHLKVAGSLWGWEGVGERSGGEPKSVFSSPAGDFNQRHLSRSARRTEADHQGAAPGGESSSRTRGAPRDKTTRHTQRDTHGDTHTHRDTEEKLRGRDTHTHSLSLYGAGQQDEVRAVRRRCRGLFRTRGTSLRTRSFSASWAESVRWGFGPRDGNKRSSEPAGRRETKNSAFNPVFTPETGLKTSKICLNVSFFRLRRDLIQICHLFFVFLWCLLLFFTTSVFFIFQF